MSDMAKIPVAARMFGDVVVVGGPGYQSVVEHTGFTEVQCSKARGTIPTVAAVASPAPIRKPVDPCKNHQFIEVGFSRSRRVCRHCDADEVVDPQPPLRNVFLLPPSNIKFARIPLLRGFTEIAPIYDLAKEHGAVIAGGYALGCCSTRPNYVYAAPKRMPDIDVFPANNEGAKRISMTLQEFGFAMDAETEFSYTLSPPKACSRKSPMTARWNFVPYAIQVIKTSRVGQGWRGIGQPKDWEDLARKVVSTFDMPVVRVAIISEREALADDRAWDHENNKIIEMDSFRNPARLIDRLCKYDRKGYRFNSKQIMGLCEKALIASVVKMPAGSPADAFLSIIGHAISDIPDGVEAYKELLKLKSIGIQAGEWDPKDSGS